MKVISVLYNKMEIVTCKILVSKESFSHVFFTFYLSLKQRRKKKKWEGVENTGFTSFLVGSLWPEKEEDEYGSKSVDNHRF